MTTPIRCGILGTGHGHDVGKLRELQQSPDWTFVGACEPDPGIRAERQRDPGWAGVRWLDEQELLDDPTVRMLAIESDVPRLLPLALKAMAAGEHLHLDKPPGTDLAGFRGLLDSARRQRRIVQMGYMFRYNSGFDLIRQAMREDWLGEVRRLHGSICTDISPDARRRNAFHPGGMMLELGCHLIDMLVLLMGRPKAVHPFLRHDDALDDGLADNTLAAFTFDRAIATVESAASEAHPFPRRRFEVCGTNGSIVLQPLEPPSARVCLREPRGPYGAGWQEVPLENIPRYVRDLAELARCIRDDQPLPYAYEHDETVQETVLRACGV